MTMLTFLIPKETNIKQKSYDIKKKSNSKLLHLRSVYTSWKQKRNTKLKREYPPENYFQCESCQFLECDISVVDKALVFGILLELPKLDESDIQ